MPLRLFRKQARMIAGAHGVLCLNGQGKRARSVPLKELYTVKTCSRNLTSSYTFILTEENSGPGSMVVLPAEAAGSKCRANEKTRQSLKDYRVSGPSVNKGSGTWGLEKSNHNPAKRL